MAENVKIIVHLKALEDLTRRYPEASAKAREARLTEALLLLEATIKHLTPQGAGLLGHIRDTIFQKVNFYGESVWGTVGMGGQAFVYGEPLEYGTNPHPVSEEGQKSIRLWVEKKLHLSGKEARSAAFCIARAIGKRGTKGAHMFEKGFEMREAKVKEILEKIPEDIVKAVSE